MISDTFTIFRNLSFFIADLSALYRFWFIYQIWWQAGTLCSLGRTSLEAIIPLTNLDSVIKAYRKFGENLSPRNHSLPFYVTGLELLMIYKNSCTYKKKNSPFRSGTSLNFSRVSFYSCLLFVVYTIRSIKNKTVWSFRLFWYHTYIHSIKNKKV